MCPAVPRCRRRAQHRPPGCGGSRFPASRAWTGKDGGRKGLVIQTPLMQSLGFRVSSLEIVLPGLFTTL
jgi:hypothetical protein